MRILLDPQVYNFQIYGGISRYYTEIFSSLKNKNEDVLIIPICNSRNIYFNESNLRGVKQLYFNLKYKVFKTFGKNLRLQLDDLNLRSVKKELQKGDFDVFVSTYYNPYFLEYLNGKPFVLTVYDMIHELFPQYFIDDPFNVSNNKRILLYKATKIIAVSENTKKDILKFYPDLDEDKIEVVYHGHSISVKNFKKTKIELPKKYILYVGSRATYKNFIFFINAVSRVLHKDPLLRVLCAGAGKFSEEEMVLFKKVGIDKQMIQYDFKESELGTLYKNAICFVFPSQYEGFGIPVLEAMISECPVLLSNHSSFYEVAGDAGVYFKLNNDKDLEEKILIMIEDSEKRIEYISLGVEQAKKFSWDKASIHCRDVYKSSMINKKVH